MLSRNDRTSRSNGNSFAWPLTGLCATLLLMQACATGPTAVKVSDERATLLTDKVNVGAKLDAQGRVDHIRLEIVTDTSGTLALGNVFDVDWEKGDGYVAVNLQRYRAEFPPE